MLRDKSLTLSQNYRRLGLTSKLNAPTGGLEKRPSVTNTPRPDPLAIASIPTRQKGMLKPDIAQVERDPATGAILRLVHSQDAHSESSSSEGGETSAAHRIRHSRRALNDPLDHYPSAKHSQGTAPIDATHNVVSALDAEASNEAMTISKRRRPRQQSAQEEEWLARLIKKHGNNVAAMAKDRRLNPMQQSEGDIKRRVRRLVQHSGIEDIAVG